MIKRNDLVLIFLVLFKDRLVMFLNFIGYLYNGGYINLIWVLGFNGGLEQFFIILKWNDNEWEVVVNIIDMGKGRVIYVEIGLFSLG